MRQPAKPMTYKKVYLGECSPPDDIQSNSTVEEIGDSVLSSDPCIVFELKDIHQGIMDGIDLGLLKDASHAAMNQMLNENPDLGTLRLFLSIPDARHLACHLIHALSRTGDAVASRLEERIESAIIEAAEMEGKPNPFLEDYGEEQNE